jgi:hypothetical protein
MLAGSLKMAAPTVNPAADVTSPKPSIASGPYTLDSGSPVKVASADVNEGMGKYDFSTSTLTLTVMQDAYATTYTSTVTVDVVSAP